METRLVIALDGAERSALVKLAKQERRDPRAQAAVIIRRELERWGLLPLPTPQGDAPALAGAGDARPGPCAEVRP